MFLVVYTSVSFIDFSLACDLCLHLFMGYVCVPACVIRPIFAGKREIKHILKFVFFSVFGFFCQDNEKRTPLHAAAYLGDAEIIELLILSGKHQRFPRAPAARQTATS